MPESPPNSARPLTRGVFSNTSPNPPNPGNTIPELDASSARPPTRGVFNNPNLPNPGNTIPEFSPSSARPLTRGVFNISNPPAQGSSSQNPYDHLRRDATVPDTRQASAQQAASDMSRKAQKANRMDLSGLSESLGGPSTRPTKFPSKTVDVASAVGDLTRLTMERIRAVKAEQAEAARVEAARARFAEAATAPTPAESSTRQDVMDTDAPGHPSSSNDQLDTEQSILPPPKPFDIPNNVEMYTPKEISIPHVEVPMKILNQERRAVIVPHQQPGFFQVPFGSFETNAVDSAIEAIQERTDGKRAAEGPLFQREYLKKPRLILDPEQGGNPSTQHLSPLPALDLDRVSSADIGTEPAANPPLQAPSFHAQIPTTAQKLYCAFGDLNSEEPWLVGNVARSSLNWSTFFIVNASRLGMPSLTLALRVEDSTSMGSHETAYFNWYAQAYDHNGNLQVQNFKYQHLDTWLKRANGKSKALVMEKLQQSEKNDPRLIVIVISCRLQLPIFTNFKHSALWNTIPSGLFDKVQGFFNESRRLDFLIACRSNNKVMSLQLPLFSRHIEEKLGMLSQYRDPETNRYDLKFIGNIQKWAEIGAGMYLQTQGDTLEMPKTYYFHFPIQFQVFAALVPIREAQLRGDYSTFQAQLTAVNEFCMNRANHLPTTNLHHLLMTGGHSNPQKSAMIDLCGDSQDNQENFWSVIQDAKHILKDEDQVHFVETLTSIRHNTLALLGPAGSGKTKVLNFVAAVLTLLGHKVLFLTSGDDLVGGSAVQIVDFARMLRSTRSNWLSEKRILQLVSFEGINVAMQELRTIIGDPGSRQSGRPNMTLDDHVRRVYFEISTDSHQQENIEEKISRRLCSSIDLVVTLVGHNNLGVLAQCGFKPTVILVDNANEIYHAALFVPLTLFFSWQALLLAGDPQQLTPSISAIRKGQNEAGENSLVSAIEILDHHGKSVMHLKTQYRMPRSIANFPHKNFDNMYPVRQGRVVDVMNDARLRFRQVSWADYGIRPSIGSEYFFLDVPNGLSRQAEGERSSFNYCNAEAILQLTQNLIREGLPADGIAVLCFQKAQVKLLGKVLGESENDAIRSIEVCGVNSFRGREASVVIVDCVQGEDLDFRSPGLAKEIPKRGSAPRTAKPMQVTRNYHRIKLALTRAKDGLVVVGQMALFVSTTYGGGQLGNTLFWMAHDAKNRGLVHTADHIVPSRTNAHGTAEIRGPAIDPHELARERQDRNIYIEHKLEIGSRTLQAKAE
ncbi:MAG: hypothetical protein Q9182_000844 [Xanthomendoza sp. 2 TL-2023]